MDDSISRQAAIDALLELKVEHRVSWKDAVIDMIDALPSAQPERKNDTIQKFCDYQVDWLTSHNDIEFAPAEESLIIRFLRDTAECYIMEVEHETL